MKNSRSIQTMKEYIEPATAAGKATLNQLR